MPENTSIYVFAYGSNMHLSRIRKRVCSAVPVDIGFVTHHKFVFHKRSQDGSAKADAYRTEYAIDRVYGVVYAIEREQKTILDEHEFLGVGYDEIQVDVHASGGSFRAWMYTARPMARDSSLLPYSWYQEYVVRGARQHRLPECYVHYLRRFESVVDTDLERHRSNLSVAQV